VWLSARDVTIARMTWTAPIVDRTRSPRLVDERACLQGWISFQREFLLWKCEGLTHEQLATRSVPPSRLSLLGLVRHMAEVEAWWFRTHAAGTPSHGFLAPDGDDFENLDAFPAPEVFAIYVEQCRLADAAVADLPLETRFGRPGEPPDDLDLRWVYLHMIEEYARHNGHADLLRELTDGETGD
jgi:Protein of unknown function (DUF664)